MLINPLIGAFALIGIAIVIVTLTAIAIILAKSSAARHRGSGSLGNAMQEIESLFVESKKHVIEAERAEAKEEDESGDPPVK